MEQFAMLAPIRYPQFAPEPALLCMLATNWNGDVPAGGLIAQEKLDGIRCLWIDGALVSREGVPIGGTDHIAAELTRLERISGERMMFDGEFQVDGALRPTVRHFQTGGRWGDAGYLHLFDALPLGEWRANTSELPLTARLQRLDHVVASACLEHVAVLAWRVHASAASVLSAVAEVWARGGEGLVLKQPDSLYRRSRSAAWAKVKQPPRPGAGNSPNGACSASSELPGNPALRALFTD